MKLYLSGEVYDRTRAFYAHALALSVRHTWDRGPGYRGTMFRLSSSATIELIDHGPTRMHGDHVSLTIGVEDVWRLHDAMQASQLPVTRIHDQEWGDSDFKLTDPSGFSITYYSPTRGVSQY